MKRWRILLEKPSVVENFGHLRASNKAIIKLYAASIESWVYISV